MKNVMNYVFCALILMGCTKEDSKKVSNENCPVINGVELVLGSQDPEIIIIGELHGMIEPPEFIDALICHSLKAGFRTAVALEVSDKKGLHKNYLSSNGGEQALEKLFQGYSWKSNITDGRSSQAMLKLFESLRQRISKNENIAFIPFLGTLDPMPFIDSETGELINKRGYLEANEKAMADKIKSSSKNAEADKTIVLVGNVHARNGKIHAAGERYRVMGDFFDPAHTVRLKAISMSGTAWNCSRSEAQELKCGETDVEGYDFESPISKALTSGYRIFLKNNPKSEYSNSELGISAFYDGFVYVGEAIASPPANAKGRSE